MSTLEDVQRNQRKRVVLALTPLTIAVFAMMVTGDKTGPYQGKVRSALVAAAFLGTAGAWFFMLWATKTRSR